MITVTKKMLVAGSLAAALAVATGCGSSSSDSSSTAASTASAAATSTGATDTAAADAGTAATGTPIVIGAPCSCSSPAVASSFTGIKSIISVWEQQTNAEGGIDGHPVKVVVTDDVGDPAKALANVKKLVESDHVVAIAGQFSNQDTAWQKYVEEKQIPVLGGQPTDAPSWTSPMFFPTAGSLIADFYGVAKVAQQNGTTKFSVGYCAEAPVCSIIPKGFGKILTDVIKDGSVVHRASISATAPNYTSPCLASKGSGANASFVADGEAIVIRYLDDCAKQGVKLAQYQIAGDVGPTYAKDPNADGTIVLVNANPLENDTTPGEKRLHAALAKYDPKLGPDDSRWNQSLGDVWSGLELFRTVALNEKLTPTSTPADVLAGVYKLKDETLGGLTQPLNYVKGKPTFNNCVYPMKVTGGKMVPDGDVVCIPADQVAATYGAFG